MHAHTLGCRMTRYGMTVTKFRKNINKSDVRVTFELNGNRQMFTGSLFQMKKKTFTKYFLIQPIPKAPRSFEIHWVGQYRVNLTAVVGIVNALYMT